MSNNWKKIKLEEVVKTMNTGLDAIKRAPIVSHPTDTKCLRIQDISQNKSFSKWGFTELKESDYEKYQLRKGEIIIARTSNSIGVNCYIEKDLNAVFNNGLARLRVKKSEIDSKFLFYVFKTSLFKNFIESIAFGTSAQPNMKVGDLGKFEFFLPPMTIQRNIAYFFTKIDKKIEFNQKMNETLEEIAKTLFKSWFIDFDPVRAKAEGRPTGLPPEISDLFPDELVDSEIGEIPKGWEVNPLGSVFLIQYGKNLPTKNLIEDGYPVFGGNGVIGFHSKYIYEEVMTLIACRGAASGKVSRSLPKSFVTNNSLVINHEGAELTSQRFIEFTLESGDPENYVTGSAQPQLTIDNIKNFPFITSPSEIVNSFQGIVNPLSDRQLLLDSENQVLSELRDTLLPKLISGELRISEAEKFLEEASI